MADIELSCRVVFGQASENGDVPPVPYRDVKLPQRLRFGYYTFGKIPAHREKTGTHGLQMAL